MSLAENKALFPANRRPGPEPKGDSKTNVVTTSGENYGYKKRPRRQTGARGKDKNQL
jgi:hypothetical protein